MKICLKCDVTCSWTLPLSQTVTSSRITLERDVLYGRPLGPACEVRYNYCATVVLTQTASLLNHLKPLLCYVK